MVLPIVAATSPATGSLAASAAQSAIGGLLGTTNRSGPAVSSSNPILSGRNYINVAPTAFNLGSIMQAYEGPPENGGAGVLTSYFGTAGAVTVDPNGIYKKPSSGISGLTVAVVAAVVVGGFIIVKKVL